MRRLSWIVLWLLVACAERGPDAENVVEDEVAIPQEEPLRLLRPPTARLEMVEGLMADLDAERAPSDGGGTAWVEGDVTASVGVAGQWQVVYEAGPLGIATGGAIVFQTSPFWGWSPPQPYREDILGYTEVTTEAEGVALEPWLASMGDGNGLLVVTVTEGPLKSGDRVVFDYGVGQLGARADRFAESGSSILISVDGDGDGIRELIEDPPGLDVAPGPVVQIAAHLPSTARPGEAFELKIALLDGLGNAAGPLPGEYTLQWEPQGPEGPKVVSLMEDSTASVKFTCAIPGIYRLAVRGPESVEGMTNPIEVSEGGRPVLWADLHGHSQLSDGTGTPEDYFRYARDVAGLDVVALTDHDHWGFKKLDQHPEVWDEIVEVTEAANDPGRFTTVVAYEWTSWIHGHRHVLHFGEERRLLSSLDPDYTTPGQLWDALRGTESMTLAHHSAGGPVATDWSWEPDPILEPLTEVMSVHGSSEAYDSPSLIYNPLPGNFVRDVLDRGYTFGFIGSGDSHDGHPGLAHLSHPNGYGGLAAIIDAENDRDSVLSAMRDRRCYATSGQRILIRAMVAGKAMGSTIGEGEHHLRIQAHGTAPFKQLDLIVRGAGVIPLPLNGAWDIDLEIPLSELKDGDYVYARLIQEDGGLAWTSPWFISSDS